MCADPETHEWEQRGYVQLWLEIIVLGKLQCACVCLHMCVRARVCVRVCLCVCVRLCLRALTRT